MADRENSECNYEVEYTDTGEAGLHDRHRACKKNPSHTKFHSLNTFTINDLPEVFQTKEVANAIKVIADLTVRIRVEYISMSRPPTFPETRKPYSNANLRGCSSLIAGSSLIVGTGFIGAVKIVRASDDSPGQSLSCPCFICKRAERIPHQVWGEVSIITAAHVLCTADELVHTEVDCFFDDDVDMDKTMKILYGNSMKASENPITKVSFADDFCQFSVITHDIDLCKRLDQYSVYDLVTMDLGVEPLTSAPLAIIVSHPHGCSKCVSWGNMTSCDTLELETPVKRKYFYNTPTCPGSSGALVWLLETSQKKWQNVYVHSAGAQRTNLNNSGTVEVFGEFISRDVPCHIS